MANVKVVWELDLTRESGKPLKIEDVKHVRVEVSADAGENYALIGDFPANVSETVVQDLDFGEYLFRGLVVDTKNRVSEPMFGSFVNEDTTPPSKLAAITVTLV